MSPITYPAAAAESPIYMHAAPWIMSVPVISTAHITAADAEQLTREAASGESGPVMGELNCECGWLLCLDCDPEEQAEEFPGYSPEFHHVLRTFRGLGYYYLRLDGDAPKVPGLPEFEW